MNRFLLALGALLIVAGLFWSKLRTLPLFRLPGDFVVDRPGVRFYFPLTTMVLISLIISLILWLFRR